MLINSPESTIFDRAGLMLSPRKPLSQPSIQAPRSAQGKKINPPSKKNDLVFPNVLFLRIINMLISIFVRYPNHKYELFHPDEMCVCEGNGRCERLKKAIASNWTRDSKHYGA